MNTNSKLKRPSRRTNVRARAASVNGDIARAMFARWEKDHVDPQPISWKKFKATLEKNRLREAPLFER